MTKMDLDNFDLCGDISSFFVNLDWRKMAKGKRNNFEFSFWNQFHGRHITIFQVFFSFFTLNVLYLGRTKWIQFHTTARARVTYIRGGVLELKSVLIEKDCSVLWIENWWDFSFLKYLCIAFYRIFIMKWEIVLTVINAFSSINTFSRIIHIFLFIFHYLLWKLIWLSFSAHCSSIQPI